MIKPIGEMILVLPDETAPGVTPGGIHLAKPIEQQIDPATVIRVGEGRPREKFDPTVDLSPYYPMPVKEGDKVLVARASGLSIYVDGKKHKMMPASQCLAVLVD